MGLFEEVMQMMERRKQPATKPAQPIGYQTPQIPPPQMVDPMQDPRLQQEMIRDPVLEQRIRQFMLEQMRQRQFNQGNASLGTRG